MNMVLGLVIFTALLIIIGVGAMEFGADSTDGNDWRTHPRI